MVGETFILQEFLQLQKDFHLCSAPDAPGGGSLFHNSPATIV